jgi:mono/diheme cytochrome c family protein
MMSRRLVASLVILGVVACGAICGLVLVSGRGFSARAEPSHVEAWLARSLRGVMVPRTIRELRNPVEATSEVRKDAMAHFADHCATCHGNDGRGATTIGRGLYPKAPDMQLADTQSLTDGELFYVIEEGIRFTGMPGWSTGTPDGTRASWSLVHLIRHLPKLTSAEIDDMSRMNPKSIDALGEEERIRDFLEGPSGAKPTGVGPPPVHHKQD